MCMEWGKYTHGSGMWGGHGGRKWVEMGGKGQESVRKGGGNVGKIQVNRDSAPLWLYLHRVARDGAPL